MKKNWSRKTTTGTRSLPKVLNFNTKINSVEEIRHFSLNRIRLLIFFLSKRFFSERFVFREKERRRDLVTSRHVTAESLALKFDFTDRSNPVSFFFSIEVKTSTRKFPFSLQIETRRSSFVEFFLRRTEFARTSWKSSNFLFSRDRSIRNRFFLGNFTDFALGRRRSVDLPTEFYSSNSLLGTRPNGSFKSFYRYFTTFSSWKHSWNVNTSGSNSLRLFSLELFYSMAVEHFYRPGKFREVPENFPFPPSGSHR